MPKQVKEEETPPESEESEEESEEEQYQVEVISKVRVAEDGEWEYYVKWAGFDEAQNSWEPHPNVRSCERLLHSFWTNIGHDNKDYQPGYEAEATKDWIAKEKRFFAQNFKPDPTPKKSKKAKAIAFTTVRLNLNFDICELTLRLLQASSSKPKSKKPLPPLPVDPDSSDSDNHYLQAKKKVPQKRSKASVSESEDSDDQPLQKTRKVEPESSNKASSSKTSASANVKRKVQLNVPRALGTNGKSQSSSSKASAGAPTKRQSSAGSSKDSVGTKDALRRNSTTDLKASTPDTRNPSALRNEKGKERAHTPPPVAQPAEPTSPHSLFSAPSSPDVSLSQLPAELTSIAPPPKSDLPAHQNRRTNPKVVLLDIPAQHMGSKGISTKARLAGAKASPAETTAPVLPSPVEKKQTLSQFSFKKKPSAQTGNTNNNPISPQIPSAGPSSSAFGRPSILADTEMVQSPLEDYSMDIDTNMAPPSPPAAKRPPLPRTGTSYISPEFEAATERLLASVMPPALAAPLYEESAPKETPRGALGPPIVPVARIQKKFKWEGELHVESDADSSRHLCNITLNEASDPRPLGLQLKICLMETQSLRCKRLHDVSDIYLVLRACAAVTQFCKLVPQESGDTPALKLLEDYMKRKRTFTYADAYLDNDSVGLLIVFPSALEDMCDMFRPPPNLRSPQGLVVALCPWTLPQIELNTFNWASKDRPIGIERPLLDPGYAGMMRSANRKVLFNSPVYQRALRILKFPQSLHDFMAQPNRPYCIWYGQPTATTSRPPDAETACLLTILTQCGATNVGLKTDVRVIYIHVGCLSTMHKINSVAARRSKRPEIRFFTYGTHESVPTSRWGMREVYPIVVVGAVAKLSSKGSDPLTLLDQNESFCTPLLSLIEDGKISLMTSPPQTRHPVRNEAQTGWIDAEMIWVSGQFSLLTMKARDILAACIRAYDSLHADTPAGEIHVAVGKNAMKEMGGMQYQPVIMDDYRRYVIIKGASEALEDKRDLLEVIALSTFDFKDEFFVTPKERKVAPCPPV
ncbi:hypothetical protein EUX98_g1848 [Antrodiella citrinella]|uniref:Chromo domain-containing protein n=1 Tax=Antrodiella citrinella TaxID=2447956 RepID=A0A4S4N0G5_9APHY|nr:hypothetical protein EUX98_g1848 [Antrodiella citrinella]